MAVYERTYNPYEGTITPPKGRFLVLPNRPTGDSAAEAAYLMELFVQYAPEVAALPPHAQTDHWTAWILNP